MADQIQAGLGGNTNVYANVRNTAGQPWNKNTPAFENYLTADYSAYVLSMTQQGSSGFFTVAFPSAIPAGLYHVTIYRFAGGGPAEGDTIIKDYDVNWNGVNLIVPLGTGQNGPTSFVSSTGTAAFAINNTGAGNALSVTAAGHAFLVTSSGGDGIHAAGNATNGFGIFATGSTGIQGRGVGAGNFGIQGLGTGGAASVNWPTNLAGANVVTVNVSTGASPIVGATVSISGGQSAIAITDVNGNAVFSLNAGTVTLAITAPGFSYSPTSQVITGPATINVVMTANPTITPSGNPALSNCYFTVHDSFGNPKIGVGFTFVLFAAGSVDGWSNAARQSATSDSNGLVQILLPIGLTWVFFGPDGKMTISGPEGNFGKFISGPGTTTQIPPYVGNF